MTGSHNSAPTQYVTHENHTYGFRRFGNRDGSPLLFLQHFRGGLDHWDPAITDGFASRRDVILFNNAGIGVSSGQTPATIEEMAQHASRFLEALGLQRTDVLGFSIGGYVAQSLAIQFPDRVGKLILVGTGPRAGDPTEDPHMFAHATKDVPDLDAFLYLFFGHSQKGQEAGKAFWERRHQRTMDLDIPSSQQTMQAQMAAAVEWRTPNGERFSELKSIHHPALVVNGTNDVMIPTINSYYLANGLPNAQLIIYPDAGHAPHYQYPDLFLKHASIFLDT
jgi:pimeloyl-ACP methyl ester carboxylesterase